MKFRLVLASLVVLLVAALAGCSSSDDKNIDLNGNWTFTYSGGYSATPMPWQITQSGTQISIVSTIPGITMVFVGTIDPSTGTFTTTFASQNQTFSGQSTDGNLINGTWSAPSFGVMQTGTFVGTRVP